MDKHTRGLRARKRLAQTQAGRLQPLELQLPDVATNWCFSVSIPTVTRREG